VAVERHANRILVDRLFAFLQARDASGMATCYHQDAHFKDPVFDVRGSEVAAMWGMLCAGAKDLDILVHERVASEQEGFAKWTATYAFSRTGRGVRNEIQSRFVFRNGLIFEQVDSFSLWKWTGMALGPVGWLLGWTPMLRSRVRRDGHRRLVAFAAKPSPTSS
jgi:ketosteroid isomerase-like protein